MHECVALGQRRRDGSWGEGMLGAGSVLEAPWWDVSRQGEAGSGFVPHGWQELRIWDGALLLRGRQNPLCSHLRRGGRRRDDLKGGAG